MNRVTTGIAVILSVHLLLLGSLAQSATRLTLHVTQEELNIWKQRAANGPYKTTGDVQQNSPGDWTRIAGRVTTNLSAETWLGNQVNACWGGAAVFNGQQPPNAYPGLRQGDALRDTGLWWLISNNVTYRDAVLATLLDQASMAGTDFSNTTKWCLTYDNDGFPQAGQIDYAINNWLLKFTFAYSYIRPSLSAGDQTTLDTWFNHAGTFWAQALHNMVAYRFPNRLTDNYTCSGTACPGGSVAITHFGGPTFSSFHYAWNNIPATYASSVAAIGALTSNATLIAAAKRYFKEWVTYCIGPDGVNCDQHRWSGSTPQTGFFYEGTAMGSMLQVADHIARTGDTELVTFSTSGGLYGWQGGPKSLLTAIEHYANIVIKERSLGTGVANYASTTSTTDPAKLIGPGTTHATDIVLAPVNLYYDSTPVFTAYTRLMPAAPFNGGYDPWGGSWGTYPGILGMWGQLEGIVSPYDLNPITPKAPTGLTVTAGTDPATEADLDWSPVTQNTDNSSLTDLGGYNVYRCIGTSCSPTSLVGGTTAGEVGGDSSTAVDTAGTHLAELCEGTTCPQQGPTWVTGQVNLAVECDGTNDNLQVPQSTDLNITGDLTLSFWARPLTIDTNVRVPFTQEGSSSAPYHFDLLSVTGNNRWRYYHHSNQFPTFSTETLTLSATSTPNNWATGPTTNQNKITYTAAPDNSDTTYIVSSTSGQQQQFAVTNPSVIQGTDSISNVQVRVFARKVPTQAVSLTVTTILSGFTQAATHVMTQSYATYNADFPEKPCAVPPCGSWTLSDVQNMEVRVQPTASRETRVSTIEVTVSYTRLADGSDTHSLTFTNYAVPANAWHHTAFVRTVADRTVRLYIDGTQQQALTYGTDDAPGQAIGQPFRLCASFDRASTRYWHGNLDEFRVYNSALSATDIGDLATNIAVGSPLAYWKFDDGGPQAEAFTATTLQPSTLYGFAVAAYNSVGRESAKSTSQYLTTGAGTPPAQGLVQALWRCSYPDHMLTDIAFSTPLSSQCPIVSPSRFRLHTAVRNDSANLVSAINYELWCRKNTGSWGAWTKVTNSSSDFDLYYLGEPTLLANQSYSTAMLPLSTFTFSLGWARRTTSSTPLELAANRQLEFLHALALKSAVSEGTLFECREYQADQTPLDTYTDASLVVRAGGFVRR